MIENDISTHQKYPEKSNYMNQYDERLPDKNLAYEKRPEKPILAVDQTFESKKLSCHYDIKRIGELSDSQKQRVNQITNIAFDQGDIDYVSNFDSQNILSLAYDDQDIWGIAMGEIKTYDADPNYAFPTLINIHSIAVHPEARGNGLCKGLVKKLKLYYHKEKPSSPLYLNVRISKNDPNIPGMKCYRKQGFRVVPVPPLDRSDGPNFFMVCEPKKKRKSKKRTKKKR